MKLFLKIILFLIFTYGFLYLALKYYSRNEGPDRNFNFLFSRIKEEKVLNVSELIYGYYNIRGCTIYFKDSTAMHFDENDFMKPKLDKLGDGYFDLAFHIQKADSIRRLFRSLNIITFTEEKKDSLYSIKFFVKDIYENSLPHNASIDSLKIFSNILVFSLDSNFYDDKWINSQKPIKLDSVWYFYKGI